MAAKPKYDSIIRALHEEWALKNGYRPQASSYKLQATSDKLHAINSQRFVDNAKPQASSGTSSNKR